MFFVYKKTQAYALCCKMAIVPKFELFASYWGKVLPSNTKNYLEQNDQDKTGYTQRPDNKCGINVQRDMKAEHATDKIDGKDGDSAQKRIIKQLQDDLQRYQKKSSEYEQ